MAGSVNSVTLLGNVGKDPEVHATKSGKEIANLTLATSESWIEKSSGERKTVTNWHKVVVFDDNLVKLVKNYVKKGSKLYLVGSLENRKYDKDGQTIYTTEVVLKAFGSQIVLLDGKDDSAPSSHEAAKRDGYAPKGKPLPEDFDDVPF